MTKYLIVAVLYLANSDVHAQNATNDSLGNLQCSAGGIAYNRMGDCTIKMKDGTRLVHCAIKELKPLYVIFVKNRVMHDVMKDKVKCIVPANENFVIWFDDKHLPVAGSDCP